MLFSYFNNMDIVQWNEAVKRILDCYLGRFKQLLGKLDWDCEHRGLCHCSNKGEKFGLMSVMLTVCEVHKIM